MSEDCTGACAPPPVFPLPVHNRPGLGRITYRVGAYADLLDEMMRRLNRDAVLAGWTHREADDPGIALLECAAMMGDVLTFYHELYANEAFLRTARWRESVADLVRLVGYRLAPGVGGRATFAFEVKGMAPVTVPAGFALKAEVESGDKPIDFETEAELAAYPALGRFHFYRPRVTTRTVTAGLTSLEVATVAGGGAVPDFRKGDRVMLVPGQSMWDDQVPWTAQPRAEVLVVDRVETVLDRTVLHFQGALTVGRGTSVKAFKLGRTFRHFGAAAPPHLITLNSETPPKATQHTTTYNRNVLQYGHYPPSGATGPFYPRLSEFDMPLDQEVNDLAAGGTLVIEARVKAAEFDWQPLTVVRPITRVAASGMVWGNLSGPCTMVTVDPRLVPNDYVSNEYVDIRTVLFHETLGPALTLRAQTDGGAGALPEPKLAFYGTRAEARALAGRPLVMEKADGTRVEAAASTAVDASLSGGADGDVGVWPVALASTPAGLTLADFDERKPAVTVYGNLVEATQGKREREAVLGNGDARQVFQTFRIPKAPLTWLPAAGQTPPVAAELEVWVSGRLWTPVDSLFGRGPTDEVYVLRQDASEESWVQFGDGKTGSRLPSGVRNVVALYRTGTGAFGALKPGKSVQAGRLDGLTKVRLPGVASGGAQPETAEVARAAAPGRIQSLGRLVSLSDVEAETLAIPGVTKARAAWELDDGVPAVVLTVLMEGGREGEFSDVENTLRDYDRCRGPRRNPLRVRSGAFAWVAVAASVSYDPTWRREEVEAAVHAALGVTTGPGGDVEGGLFSTGRRAFAEGEWANRVVAAIQNVPGVLWTQLTTLKGLGTHADPSGVAFPAPGVEPSISCEPRHVLRLHAAHLQLTPVGAAAPEC